MFILSAVSSFASPIKCSTPAQPYAKLSLSCLKSVMDNNQAVDNLRYFEPTYSLFSNKADKRRWIYIPSGSKIDSSNADGWIYPVGTILWKEFSLDGRKIETRQLEKMKAGTGPSAWRTSIYLWREDQLDADFSSDGRTTPFNVRYEFSNHTQRYSVPTASSCNMCHRGATDMSLGFSYLNLSGDSKPGLRLADLSKNGWLGTDLTKPDQIMGSEKDQKVLGYLHMNCASCHNPRGYASYMFHMNHVSGTTELKQETAYKNTVGKGYRTLIHPGDPARSFIFERLSNGSMPPDFAVQKHGIDETAKSMMYEWIDSLSENQ